VKINRGMNGWMNEWIDEWITALSIDVFYAMDGAC
jgi:hypothetical protein